MFFVDDERGTSSVSLLGAFLWAVLAALAGSGIAPLGVIELLFLFAPLVAVPLGFALLERISVHEIGWAERAARAVQPLAALSLVVGFWRGPGTIAGLMSVPWATVCGAVAFSGLVQLGRRISLTNFVGSIARIDLGVAGIFLLLSRFGIHLRFQEPIVLLTAVHFHFSGFATSAIALGGLRFAERSTRRRAWIVVATAVSVLPSGLAAGFVFSPILKVVSAVLFSTAVAALACLLFEESREFHLRTARIFIGLATASVIAGMTLAATYAVGEYLHRDWITIPRMASTHGWINALGFAMPALLGCLAELRAEAEALPTSLLSHSQDSRQHRTKIARPRFVARDFYDL
jgi:hypothetical protein